MTPNEFGQRLRMMSFGESHGPAVGVVVDGVPAGLRWDHDLLLLELARRRPGGEWGSLTSSRAETDQPEVLSGVFEGKTLGTPIAMVVRNVDARSQDYAQIKNNPRQGHGDRVWLNKFGHVDYRGGGRASGRETVSRVMAGAVAKMLLKALAPKMSVTGFISRIGDTELTDDELNHYLAIDQSVANESAADQTVADQKLSVSADNYAARFPSERAEAVAQMLEQAKQNGESYGATVAVVVRRPLAGLGQPVFHKLKADLAAAIMGIGAVHSFQMGMDSEIVFRPGTSFHLAGMKKNYSGVVAGISTGDTIFLSANFKPTSSILDVAKKGRHDPCVAIRAVPVIEAMVNLVLADHLLWARGDKLDYS